MVNAPKIQMQYSTFLQDLQGDSDEAKSIENTDLNVELPGSDDSAHFKRFDIKCRDEKSKDVKSLLNTLENEPMLFSLIRRSRRRKSDLQFIH